MVLQDSQSTQPRELSNSHKTESPHNSWMEMENNATELPAQGKFKLVICVFRQMCRTSVQDPTGSMFTHGVTLAPMATVQQRPLSLLEATTIHETKSMELGILRRTRDMLGACRVLVVILAWTQRKAAAPFQIVIQEMLAMAPAAWLKLRHSIIKIHRRVCLASTRSLAGPSSFTMDKITLDLVMRNVPLPMDVLAPELLLAPSFQSILAQSNHGQVNYCQIVMFAHETAPLTESRSIKSSSFGRKFKSTHFLHLSVFA